MKKGVILETRGRKSVVLFNDGSVRVMSTPRGCADGSVVTVFYNTWGIARLAALGVLALAACFFSARALYFTPVGYVEIAYNTRRGVEESVTLVCNRFERVLAVYPSTNSAVFNKTIDAASEALLDALDVPPSAPLRVCIASAGETRVAALRERLGRLRVTRREIIFDAPRPAPPGEMMRERLENMREKMRKNLPKPPAPPTPPNIITPDVDSPGRKTRQGNGTEA
jgi:hypothetical protein